MNAQELLDQARQSSINSRLALLAEASVVATLELAGKMEEVRLGLEAVDESLQILLSYSIPKQ